MPDGNSLKWELLDLLRDESRDLWEQEDLAFLEALATDLAREKFLAATSEHPEVHERNLRHLAATFAGEASRKKLRLNAKGKELFGRVLGTLVRTVASSALKAWVG